MVAASRCPRLRGNQALRVEKQEALNIFLSRGAEKYAGATSDQNCGNETETTCTLPLYGCLQLLSLRRRTSHGERTA